MLWTQRSQLWFWPNAYWYILRMRNLKVFSNGPQTLSLIAWQSSTTKWSILMISLGRLWLQILKIEVSICKGSKHVQAYRTSKKECNSVPKKKIPNQQLRPFLWLMYIIVDLTKLRSNVLKESKCLMNLKSGNFCKVITAWSIVSESL